MLGRRVVCFVMNFLIFARYFLLAIDDATVARHFGALIGKRLCLLNDGDVLQVNLNLLPFRAARNSEISRLKKASY